VIEPLPLSEDAEEQVARTPPWSRRVFWAVALAYFWGLSIFLTPALLLGWYHAGVIIFGYPLLCGISGLLLMKRKRTAHALINMGFGILWFVIACLTCLQTVSKNLWH